MVYASLHERGLLYMHAPHQHANSTQSPAGYGPAHASYTYSITCIGKILSII